MLITTVSFAQKIKTGADNYTVYLPLLKGKSIGIVTNQTGIMEDKTHLVDFLVQKNQKKDLKLLFLDGESFLPSCFLFLSLV